MTTEHPERPVHLVGSVPLVDASEVFERVGSCLGHALHAIPDGETGERLGWIRWFRARLASVEGLEYAPAQGVEGQDKRDLRVKEGVRIGDLQLGPLGYLDEALKSYKDFLRIRDSGKIAPGTRMQVAIPTPLALALGVQAPIAELAGAFQRAAIAEVQELCSRIPARDLCIQWDVCVETILEQRRRHPSTVREGVAPRVDGWTFERSIQCCIAVCDAVPAAVPVGIHLCYGDPDGSAVVRPHDASVVKDIANALSAGVHRTLNWIHMPVPIDRDDDVYFAPLADLKLQAGAQLYLGLIHQEDGVGGARRRMTAAKKAVSTFGVATECGLGRLAPEIVPDLLQLHKEVAALR